MKRSMHRNIQLFVIMVFIGIFFFGCGKPEIQPEYLDPAYRTKLLLEDRFERGLDNWIVMGKAAVNITADSSLGLNAVSDTVGAAVWTKASFPENFQLEYDIFIRDTAGSHTVYFCVEPAGGETFRADNPPSEDLFNDFIRNRITSYQILVHCFDRNGKALSGTKLRKNPGNLLLSGSPSDPCRDNRKYLLDVIKVGSRIQFFVDGSPVHDIRDRGGFGPVYIEGRIGFMVQGKADAFRVLIDNVRVFKLIPR
jgi:hypothetical protein